jgi:fatty acid amide hydrolase 2
MIRSREVSSVQVVEAHVARLREIAPRVNAVAKDRFGAALDEASAADARIADAGPDEVLPPLLGVPFTVKESIAVHGMPHSAGLVARCEVCASETAPVVARLIEAGAIPMAVTNTSELTLWIESSNLVYGRTNNPYDPTRAAGGSSGGEGAAVGSGGSPFGVGSDLGGSIRIPALFCGVFGHKPSPGLVPSTGNYPPAPPGDTARMLGIGPLARRAEDLMPLLQIMAGPDGVDPDMREVALGDPASVSLEGLRVVTVDDATFMPLSGEVRDARERAVGALAAAGARLSSVSLRSWRRAALAFLATLQAGAGPTATTALLEEAGVARPTWRALVRRGGPHTLPTRITLGLELLPAGHDAAARARLLAAGRRVASELVEAIGDGVLLHPAHPRVAPRHGRTVARPWLLTPAAVFNLAGVPVTEVPLGLTGRGLPVGVQVATGRDRDHVSIAVATRLERVFGGWVSPPVYKFD